MHDVEMIDIIIVNYNSKDVLINCINSIINEETQLNYNLWIIDNASTDDSVEDLKEFFPKVNIIKNELNEGFSKANNKIIKMTSAHYILLLNPDTIVYNNSISGCLNYIKEHSEVGIVGCKVLNPDGTLQLACRRSIPTPVVALFRLIGLSKLFPNNKMFAKYNLTYLNDHEINEVDAVSGAFLMIKRDVVNKVGLLDEHFFMFGEELDWCMRVKNAGFKVIYYPKSFITHLKGESCKRNPKKARWEFYRAMLLFHKKHWAGKYIFVFNWIVYSGIFLLYFISKVNAFLVDKLNNKNDY